jgi:hypothetical protein
MHQEYLKGAQRRGGRARASSGIRRGHPTPFLARCEDGKELAKWVTPEQICDDILRGRRSPLIKIPMCHQWKAVKGRMQR